MKTIELKLTRKVFHDKATLGDISRILVPLALPAFVCYTLEDKDRGLTDATPLNDVKLQKVYGETCIPYGRYRIIKAWSPHFKRYMPLLLDVHGFQAIELHGGNTVADSLGCILCAHTQDVINDRIQGKAEDSIMAILNEAERDNKEVWITITK